MSSPVTAASDRSSTPVMAAIALAVVALALFILAVTTTIGEWGYFASMVCALGAVILGVPARKRAASPGMATVAVALGGLLLVAQILWLVLEALGVVED